MQLRAMGKINLGLDVTGVRPDGYHEVRMVMQTVRMFDRLTFTRTAAPGVRIASNLRILPTGSTNLVWKAITSLVPEEQLNPGIGVFIEKRIPVAAGMAGGSADAAAALIAANRMFGLGLSMDQLMEKGLALGADIPYCLMRGTALAEGIGETLKKLPSCPDCIILIAKPPEGASTRQIYQNLVLDDSVQHPDIDGLCRAIERGRMDEMLPCMGNVLEPVTSALCPAIRRISARMMECGADKAMMTGSGPTVFGIFRDRGIAERAKQVLLKAGDCAIVYVTSPFTPAA